MKQITKEVLSKGEVVATCTANQAETWEEACAIAGGEPKALELFNREYLTVEMNKLRPQRSMATGAKKFSGILKKLSPEVQNALKDMDEEKLAAVLAKVAGGK